MTTTAFQSLTCPLDGAPLHFHGATWRCASGHSFDIASQGYINLLPVQKKRSLDPGDHKDMVAARRRFLHAGFYQGIANAVNQIVLQNISPTATLNCLDAGCGEGYYLRQLAASINPQQTLSIIGLDISKWAVLSAAKQAKQLCWVVGSNANLPIQTGTLDRVLCLFGFPVYNEFARTLKTGGQLLQVDAGTDHLRELREIIYPTIKPDRVAELSIPDGFIQHTTKTVRYPIELTTTEQIADLLAMTPHLYRASAEGRAKAESLTELTVTVDVQLKSFERVGMQL